MMAELRFLGAAKTVTGSKYLVTCDGVGVMVDCGLFQGPKELRLRNWEEPPVAPRSLSAIVLTHAHIDHTGYLPRMVKQGFRGPVYASDGTAELCALLLPDSGRLQEEDARLANDKGFSKHRPALPLYTERDAREALKLIQPIRYGETVALSRKMTMKLASAGHILGSSLVEVTLSDGPPRTLLCSGDLGRYDVPILDDPSPVARADYLVIESTYGDRLHDTTPVADQLADVINRTLDRQGRVLIPAFAVGRTQEVLFLLRELEDAKRIPVVPAVVDSPMAEAATESYRSGHADHDAEMRRLIHKHIEPFVTHRFQFGAKKGDADFERPRIVISASGMATGGRVLNHLRVFLPDPRCTVVFAGFQAAGTRGRRLLEGEKEIKIHGELIPVRAEIASISGLSAHADYEEILRWLSGFESPPRSTFVTHGEPVAAEALRRLLAERLGWTAVVPEHLQTVGLGP